MELLRFAIDMERDGEKYYRTQGLKNADNPLRKVFDLLADDEKKHAEILSAKAEGAPYTLAHGELHAQPNPFQTAKDYVATAQDVPDQAELYEKALEMEVQSISLYEKMRQLAGETPDVELFAFLIREESRHQAILNDLYHHVNRPKEWVESAEFGVREDY